ncbi:hypothetical protein LJC57_03700 [Parabacteroides sp. OttesenSCG-928-G07]|nr:hypothetical protein [Parabacteroides sp. OttesenSCG-928-G07]
MKYRLLYLFVVINAFVFQLAAQDVHERVYVHTDKQSYLTGEMVWMKLYTTDGDGRLQTLSKVGYVELVSATDPEAQVKIELADGVGSGWLEVPSALKTGYYHLVAYTRYMHNEGESVFYQKPILIINPFELEGQRAAGNISDSPMPGEEYGANTTTIALSTNKSGYTKREKGEIRISRLPEEAVSLSVSIAGEEPFVVNTNTIARWKKELPAKKNNSLSGSLLPEYEGAIIDAVLVNMDTEATESASDVTTLLSFPGKEIQLFGGQADDKGNVSFYTQQVTGKKELTTTAISANGKRFRVDLKPLVSRYSATLPVFSAGLIEQDYLLYRNLSVQVSQAYLADKVQFQEIPVYSYLNSSREYVLDNYTRFPNMEEVFLEFISMARIRKINNNRFFSVLLEGQRDFSSGYALVLLDNIPITDHDKMCDYNPLLIRKIDIYQGNYSFGGNIFSGIVSFSTYNNDYPGIVFDESTQLLDYEGTQVNRYFYSPDYGVEPVNSRMPDFRHTLLWEPLLDSEGRQTITIPFYTSDLTGKYQITVEGIGREGTIIFKQSTFEVTE